MRLNIAKTKDQEIEGYKNVAANEQIIENVQSVANNSCEEILCLNSLENLPNEIGNKVLELLVQKTRNLGTLHISGLDFNSLCNSYINDTVSIKDVNSALSNVKTIYNYKEIIMNLEQKEFVIEVLLLKGQTYQIEAKRIKNNA
tara:strand:+ start:637 stop:1068 length:432 start_codon:yes stop_codon:yes gene_type:complete